MKPLKFHQQMMKWMFICADNEIAGKYKKSLFAIIGVTIFLSQIIAVTGSLAYFIKFLSIDIELALYTTFQITTCGSAAYVFALAFFSRYKIKAVFNNLTEIFDECKYSIVENVLIQFIK